MLELAVTDLILPSSVFQVPSILGTWEFEPLGTTGTALAVILQGQCAVTYAASLPAITHTSPTSDLERAMYEALDICLILSFVTARCVTIRGGTPQSDIQFISLPDHFLRSRAIEGFPGLPLNAPIGGLFASGITNLQAAMAPRNLRLLLSLWVGGLTCFNLEDLFMAVAVVMDVVKQSEMRALGGCELSYFKGMQNASKRYSIAPLSPAFKNMRNDLLHEGGLSGTNIPGLDKAAAADIVADTLAWVDRYVVAVLQLERFIAAAPRWIGADLAQLPALSL